MNSSRYVKKVRDTKLKSRKVNERLGRQTNRQTGQKIDSQVDR